jgi:monoamine oxidase
MNSRIVIVGGGAAGISALSKLLENGFRNVILLEAESRIGGRVHTVPFASNVVDLGAQWCHGEKDNIVYELVAGKSKNVLEETPRFYMTCPYIDSNGDHHPEASELEELAFEILGNCEEDVKDTKGSLGSYFIGKYQEALRTDRFKHITSELAQQFLENFHKFENSIEASDNWFETSANGYLEYHECEGHNLLNWKDKGYKTVFDYITKKQPNPSENLNVEEKIQFEKEVSNITWPNSTDGPAKVVCRDGSTFDADHVIVTVSLGVLKENSLTMFTPALPLVKVNAIQGLSIGVVDKIFLEWEQPFWESDFQGFGLLWTKNDSDLIRNTDNAWVEDVFGIWPVSYQPNILCGWICGPSARHMEKLDDQTILNGIMFLLEKFLGKTMKCTKPKRILPTRWYSNPHFRGSYSFRSLTTDLLKTSARDLAQPLYNPQGKPTLLFAGEATHDHYYSTVHGAVASGFREAQRLIDFNRKIKSHL